MASLNITSLPRHIDELRVWMRDQNLDLLAINETRLDSSIPNESVKIINYQIIRKDRNRFGGGVSIYVRDSLNYVNKSTIVCDEIEAVCLEINKPNSKPFVVISCYRPPSYNPTKFFEYIETIINGWVSVIWRCICYVFLTVTCYHRKIPCLMHSFFPCANFIN